MPLPVNSIVSVVTSAGGTSLPTTVIAYAVADVLVEQRQTSGSYLPLTSPADYTAAISSVSRRVTITLPEATTDIVYRVSNVAAVQQLSDYSLASYDPTRITADFDKAYLHLQRLYAGIADLEAAADAAETATALENLEGLIDDGTTDQTQAFIDLAALAISEGRPLNLIGKADGSSEILIDRRAILPALPADFSVSRITFIFNAANGAGINVVGDEVELPAVGKAKLWTDVDVSGSPVTSFDIDVSADDSIVDLLVAGAFIVIRGKNGADGDVLTDDHKHECRVVSCVLVSGNQYALTIDTALPTGVGDTWYREWPDSNHVTQPDNTLISVVASALATANMTDSRTMSVASGTATALGLVEGSWVQVLDDAVGSDTHGTSNELVNQQTVQVAAVADTLITFDEPIRGTLTTANNARLVVLEMAPEFLAKGPGPFFPVRVIGTPPASPASRRHIFEAKFATRPTFTNWRYVYVEADGTTRGAFLRTSNCHGAKITGNWIENPDYDFVPAQTGGDYYGIWDDGSTGTIIESNYVRGGRHCIVAANFTNGAILNNDIGHAIYQNLDLHGEGGYGMRVAGNRITRGPAWSERDRYVAIQVGNQTHTFGDRDVLIEESNEIIGFDGAADIGVLIISGCEDIIVNLSAQHIVGIGVQVKADRRAPTVAIDGILISGATRNSVTAPFVIDGRMPTWEEGAGFEGSATRPTYCETSEGAVWSTTGDDVAGAYEPEIGETPEVDVSTWDDGNLTWTLRALTVYSPIGEVTIKGAVVDGAASAGSARRVAELNLLDCKLTADEGFRLFDCPAFRAQNVQARLGGSGNGDWLIDEGGNAGEYRVVDANGGGVDGAGGSIITDATPSGGGGSGTLTAFTDATIPITAAGALTRAMRRATTLDTDARLNEIEILLAAPGRVDLPADALVGDNYAVTIVGGSETVTMGVDGDAGDIVGSTTIVAAPAGKLLFKCVDIDGGTGDRTYEVDGPVVGATSYVHGPLEAVDPSGTDQRSTLSGFNALAEGATEKTASFTFDAGQAGQVVPANHATVAIVATIPSNASVPYPLGTVLAVLQTGAAAASLAIDTDTLRTLSGRTLVAAGQYSHIGARKIATTEWVAIGDFGAA